MSEETMSKEELIAYILQEESKESQLNDWEIKLLEGNK